MQTTGSNPKAMSGKGPAKAKPTTRKPMTKDKVIKGSNKNSGAGYSEDDGGSVTKSMPKKKSKK